MGLTTGTFSLVEWSKKSRRWTIHHHLEEEEVSVLNTIFLNFKKVWRKFPWEEEGEFRKSGTLQDVQWTSHSKS